MADSEPQKPVSGDGHRVELHFDGGSFYARLIHPDSGCTPAAWCGHYERPFVVDPEREQEACTCGYAPADCWLEGWDEDLTEYLAGKITVSVEAVWDGDCPLVQITEAVKARAL